jgi:hypothetical protein
MFRPPPRGTQLSHWYDGSSDSLGLTTSIQNNGRNGRLETSLWRKGLWSNFPWENPRFRQPANHRWAAPPHFRSYVVTLSPSASRCFSLTILRRTRSAPADQLLKYWADEMPLTREFRTCWSIPSGSALDE